MKKSVAALIEFYGLLRGTHSLEDRFTDEQLTAVLNHAEGHLRFLIEISTRLSVTDPLPCPILPRSPVRINRSS